MNVGTSFYRMYAFISTLIGTHITTLIGTLIGTHIGTFIGTLIGTVIATIIATIIATLSRQSGVSKCSMWYVLFPRAFLNITV